MERHLLIVFFIHFLAGQSLVAQQHTSLRKQQLEKLLITVKPSSLVVPGAKVEIGVTAFSSDGKELRSTGWLGGKIKWKNYEVTTSGGEFRNGELYVSNTLNPSLDSLIELKVKSRYHEGTAASQLIRVNQLKTLELFTNLSYSSEISPGSTFPIDVAAQYDNGMETSTSGMQAFSNKFRDFNIKVKGGFLSGSQINVYENYHQIPAHKVSVIISSKFYPKIKDTLEVKLNYKRKYEVYFRGRDGEHGSLMPYYNTISHGGNGGGGEPGGDGADIKVYVDSYHDPILFQKVAKVSVIEEYGFRRDFLINPNGGSLSIISQGGEGGDGANGENGCPGIPGRDGAIKIKKEKINDSTVVESEVQDPGENGGPGGHGGNGGSGGNGGNGGTIKIFYTKAAQPFLHIIIPRSIAGRSGSPGFGGNGGPGGAGGKGKPDGAAGLNGLSGTIGFHGFSGNEGRVIFKEVVEIDLE